MTKFEALLAISAITLVSAACGQAEDFGYTINNGTVTITQYLGPGGVVAIPSSINQLPVVALGDFAFYDSGSKITNIALPSTLSGIGLGGFDGCPNLTEISVDAASTAFVSVDGVLFSKDQTALVAYPDGRVGAYSIPNGVTTLGDYAFYFCGGLTGATIPNSLTNIGKWSFAGCGNLASVTVGNSVRSIGSLAFSWCGKLTAIALPDSLKHIENGIPAIGEGGAFGWCSSLTNVTLGSGLTNLGDYTFIFCTSLTSITVPDSVFRLGVNALLNCSGLTNVAVGSGITNLSASDFLGCSGLASINVSPANTVYSSVDGVVFNKSQTSLLVYPPAKPGNYTIADNVTGLAQWVFYNCYGLTGIKIGSGLATLGDSTFSGCTSLTNITFSQNLTSIGPNAFVACTNLIYVTVPGSVTNIGDSAFAQCTSLLGVFFQGNAPMGSTAFDLASNATVYYLPGTTGWVATLSWRPTVRWNPKMQTGDGNFGVRLNRFGFNITGRGGIPLVIEASASLAPQSWVPLQNCTLTNGSLFFSDAQWTNYPGRFYRIRSP